MPTVDNLDIQIKSSADSAVRSVDRLADSVSRLAQNLSFIGGNIMTQFSSSLGSVSSNMNNLSMSISNFKTQELRNASNAMGAFSHNADKMAQSAQKLSFRQMSTEMSAVSKIAEASARDIAKNFGITDVQSVEKLISKFVELGDSYRKDDADRTISLFEQISDEIWKNRNVVSDYAREYKSLIESIQAVNRSGTKIKLPFNPTEFVDEYTSMRATLGKAFTSSADIMNGNTMSFDSFVQGLPEQEYRMLESEMIRLGLNTNSLASAFQALVSIKKQYNEATTKGAAAESAENASLEAVHYRVFDVGDKFKYLFNAMDGVTQLGQGETKSALEVISSELNKLSGISIPNAEQLNSVANAIAKISRIETGNLQNLNLDNAGREIDSFANSLSNVQKVSSGTTALINATARLAASGNNMDVTINELPRFSQSLKNLISTMSNAAQINQGTTTMISSIGQLANSGRKIPAVIANLDSLGQSLKRFMTTMSTAPAVNNSVVSMTQALGNLNRTTVNIGGSGGGGGGSSGGFSGFLGKIKTAGTLLSATGSKVGMVVGALTRFIPVVNHSSKSTKGFVSAIGMFYARFFLLIRAFSKIKSVVEDAMDSIEVVNYFNAAVEQVTKRADLSKWQELGYDSAESYANSFKEGMLKTTEQMSGYTLNAAGNLVQSGMKNFGIDSSILMNYQAQFAQMASSIGVSSEYSTKISRAMTEIGADLASVKNMDFKDVWDNLSSGLTGMSRAVDKYGINIRNAALQTELQRLGIDATVNSLSQADKAMLRTIVILNSSEYAWGDLADTLSMPANQTRVLENQVSMLGRAIGNIFLPIVAKVLPYLNQLVYALRELAEWIVQLLGFEDFDWGNATGADNSAIGDLLDDTEGVADNIDKAADNAKKFKNQLQGFDKLNNLTTTDDSDKGSGGTGTGGIDTGLLDAALDDALSRYQKRWDKAFKNMNQSFSEFADNIKKAFKKGGMYEVGAYIARSITESLGKVNWNKYKKGAYKAGRGLGNLMAGLLSPNDQGKTLFGSVATAIAESINVVIQSFNGWERAFNNNKGWKNLGKNIAQFVANTIDTIEWDEGISLAGRIARGVATSINSFLSDESEPVKKIGVAAAKLVKTGIEALYKFVITFNFKDLGQKIADSINAFFNEMNKPVYDDRGFKTGMNGWQKLGYSISGTITGIATTLITALDSVEWKTVGQAIGDFIGNIEWEDIIWDLGKLASSLLKAVVDTIIGVFSSDFTADDMMKNINPVMAPIDLILGFFGLKSGDKVKPLNLTELLSKVFNFDNASNWFDKAAEAFKNAGKGYDWMDIGSWILEGILDGIVGAFTFITEPFVDLFNLMWNAICDVFGIASPAKKMKPIGNFIAEGLLEGIKDVFGGIAAWLKKNILQPIVEFFSNDDNKPGIQAKLVTTWNDLKGKWGEITSNVKDVVINFKAVVATKWADIRNSWISLTSHINDIVANFKAKIATKWSDIKNGWSSLTNNIEDKTANFKAKVATKWADIKDKWNSLMSNIKDKVAILTAKVVDRASSVLSALKNSWNAIRTKTSTLTAKAINKSANVLSTLKSSWDSFATKTVTLTAKFQDLFTTPLKKSWNAIADAINKGISNINKIPGVNIPSVTKLATGGYIPNNGAPIKRYATGGMPDVGTLFIAGEAGAEVVANARGGTEVLNESQIAASIAAGVADANAQQNAIMRQQNQLLREEISVLHAILDKTGISDKEIFQSVRRSNDNYARVNGHGAFA